MPSTSSSAGSATTTSTAGGPEGGAAASGVSTNASCLDLLDPTDTCARMGVPAQLGQQPQRHHLPPQSTLQQQPLSARPPLAAQQVQYQQHANLQHQSPPQHQPLQHHSPLVSVSVSPTVLAYPFGTPGSILATPSAPGSAHDASYAGSPQTTAVSMRPSAATTTFSASPMTAPGPHTTATTTAVTTVLPPQPQQQLPQPHSKLLPLPTSHLQPQQMQQMRAAPPAGGLQSARASLNSSYCSLVEEKNSCCSSAAPSRAVSTTYGYISTSPDQHVSTFSSSLLTSITPRQLPQQLHQSGPSRSPVRRAISPVQVCTATPATARVATECARFPYTARSCGTVPVGERIENGLYMNSGSYTARGYSSTSPRPWSFLNGGNPTAVTPPLPISSTPGSLSAVVPCQVGPPTVDRNPRLSLKRAPSAPPKVLSATFSSPGINTLQDLATKDGSLNNMGERFPHAHNKISGKTDSDSHSFQATERGPGLLNRTACSNNNSSRLLISDGLQSDRNAIDCRLRLPSSLMPGFTPSGSNSINNINGTNQGMIGISTCPSTGAPSSSSNSDGNLPASHRTSGSSADNTAADPLRPATVVLVGQFYIFRRRANQRILYPLPCQEGASIQVLEHSALKDPPVLVRWPSGFTYRVHASDLFERKPPTEAKKEQLKPQQHEGPAIKKENGPGQDRSNFKCVEDDCEGETRWSFLESELCEDLPVSVSVSAPDGDGHGDGDGSPENGEERAKQQEQDWQQQHQQQLPRKEGQELQQGEQQHNNNKNTNNSNNNIFGPPSAASSSIGDFDRDTRPRGHNCVDRSAYQASNFRDDWRERDDCYSSPTNSFGEHDDDYDEDDQSIAMVSPRTAVIQSPQQLSGPPSLEGFSPRQNYITTNHFGVAGPIVGGFPPRRLPGTSPHRITASTLAAFSAAGKQQPQQHMSSKVLCTSNSNSNNDNNNNNNKDLADQSGDNPDPIDGLHLRLSNEENDEEGKHTDNNNNNDNNNNDNNNDNNNNNNNSNDNNNDNNNSGDHPDQVASAGAQPNGCSAGTAASLSPMVLPLAVGGAVTQGSSGGAASSVGANVGLAGAGMEVSPAPAAMQPLGGQTVPGTGTECYFANNFEPTANALGASMAVTPPKRSPTRTASAISPTRPNGIGGGSPCSSRCPLGAVVLGAGSSPGLCQPLTTFASPATSVVATSAIAVTSSGTASTTFTRRPLLLTPSPDQLSPQAPSPPHLMPSPQKMTGLGAGSPIAPCTSSSRSPPMARTTCLAGAPSSCSSSSYTCLSARSPAGRAAPTYPIGGTMGTIISSSLSCSSFNHPIGSASAPVAPPGPVPTAVPGQTSQGAQDPANNKSRSNTPFAHERARASLSALHRNPGCSGLTSTGTSGSPGSKQGASVGGVTAGSGSASARGCGGGGAAGVTRKEQYVRAEVLRPQLQSLMRRREKVPSKLKEISPGVFATQDRRTVGSDLGDTPRSSLWRSSSFGSESAAASATLSASAMAAANSLARSTRKSPTRADPQEPPQTARESGEGPGTTGSTSPSKLTFLHGGDRASGLLSRWALGGAGDWKKLPALGAETADAAMSL